MSQAELTMTASHPIYGFMHVATMGNWDAVVEEQLALLQNSGLYAKTSRLFITLLGPERSRFRIVHPNVQIIHSSEDVQEYEFPTLRAMASFCQSHEGLVYYLHTKGVTRDTPPVTDWRRYMEYFVVERHEDCIRALETHDVCGVDWLSCPWPHFSGNFWWARADYIRSLPDIGSLGVVPYLDHTRRHNCERWIGCGPSVRAASLFQSCVDHYQQRLPPEAYRTIEGARLAPACHRDLHKRTPQGALPRYTNMLNANSSCNGDPDPVCSDAHEIVVHDPNTLPIHGFMHVAMVRHWQQIVVEQLLKMRASGLWERTQTLHVGLLGPGPTEFPCQDPKINIRRLGTDFSPAERPTLAYLQEFCQDHECLTYYVHTKGVFHPCHGQEEWRRCMEHFVLLNYGDCIHALKTHDVCGINWGEYEWCRMFRGNFWWARSEYIRTLPDIGLLTPLPGLEPGPRHVCERWIGENPRVRAACLHVSPVDHYHDEPYPRSRYARLREIVPSGTTGPSAWSGLENRFQDLLEPLRTVERVVDIGAPDGLSLLCLATALPQATVIGVARGLGVDHGKHERPPQPTSCISADPRTSQLRCMVREHPNIMLLEMDDQKVAEMLEGQVDVLHIGNVAEYEAMEQVFLRWESRIRPGGCLLLHGTTRSPGVDRFYTGLVGRKAEIRDCGGLGAWYKAPN